MKNICLVGVGPHAKRIYIKYFSKYNIMPKIIVELISKEKDTREFLDGAGIKDYEMVLLDDKYKDNVKLDKDFYLLLADKCKEHNITHAIISTEPKAHNSYINFFLDQKIPTISDKPITVRKNMLSLRNVKNLDKDFKKIVYKSEKNKTNLEIMCQRSCHSGYNYIKQLLKETIEKYNVPITYCSVYHCDGKWMMPHDLDCENHPYKYGYGKLFHSGYHFIHLLSELVSLNNVCKDPQKKICSAEISSTFISPNDELAEITYNDYKSLFKDQSVPEFYNLPQKDFKKYGEKNNYSLLAFKNKNNRTITVAELNLLQNGFSRRGWIKTKQDEYKGNGRIRHESINIQVGTLMNIQVHSYQSKEIKDRQDNEDLTGGLDHFDIHIYRNSDIIGGKTFEIIKLKDIYERNCNGKLIEHNEKSREEMLTKFLDNKNGNSIESHFLGIKLLQSISKLYLRYTKNNKINHTKLKI